MPRPLTPAQRQRIHARLLEAGRRRFARAGIRKTTVAELAGDAGIGKGTFYQFFPSKEALFFILQEEAEAEARVELLRQVEALEGRPREQLRRYLEAQFEVLAEHPLLSWLADPDELASLLRALPPEHLEAHHAGDLAFFGELAGEWIEAGWLRGLSPEDLAAVSVMIFSLEQQRRRSEPQTGPQFERIRRIVVDALVHTYAGGGEPTAPQEPEP